MSLETTITNAWQTQAKWLYLLLPLSWLYGIVSKLRKVLYDKGLLTSYRADVPVMVIGNITVGGSGKTPLIISLVKYLQRKNIKVGVISRGYGGDTSQMPALVTLDSMPNMVGDEPCLIVQSTLFYGAKVTAKPVAMAVCPNRQQAIECLLEHHPDIQLVIADDGLQHYKLQRDIEWIVVDSHRGFGNAQLLPAGFLREPLSRLNGATVVSHQVEESTDETPLTMRLQPSQLEPLLPDFPAMQKPQNGDKIIVVSGIGYPTRFFATLRALGFEVEEQPFPDHHDFSLADLVPFVGGNKAIIITSKDAVKLRQLAHAKTADLIELSEEKIAAIAEVFTRIWILPVDAKLSQACYDELDKELKKFKII